MSAIFVTDIDLLKSHIKGYTKKDGTVVKPHETKVLAHGKISDGLKYWQKDAIKAAVKNGYTFKEDANFLRVFKTAKDEDGHTTLTGLIVYPDGKALTLPDQKPVGNSWESALGLSKKTTKPAAVSTSKQSSLFPGEPAAHGSPKTQKVVAPQYGVGGSFGGGYGKTGGLFGGMFGSDWFSKKDYPKPEPKAFHPKLDDDGKKVGIYHPSKSQLEGFDDSSATVTILPGDKIPESLNGIPFTDWTPPADWDGWADVEGQIDIDEPPLETTGHKQEASGVVIIEPDGRAWVVSPTNKFGGYKHSFTKGKNEEDLPLQANAIKECYEESGLKVEILGLLGDVERTTSVSRYYLARRVAGSPADVGWESQAVSLVPIHELHDFLDSKNDHDVVDLLGKYAG